MNEPEVSGGAPAPRDSVRQVLPADCVLGEGPFWSAEEGVLYWLDIRLQKLHAWRPATAETRTQRLPAPTGAAAPCADGRLLVATSRGIGRFDTRTARFDLIANTAPDWPRSRYNDGKCDRAGRFWTGTMRLKGPHGQEKLYRLEPDLGFTCADGGFTLCNGLGWSPDDRCLYLADSHAGCIFVYDFDLATGSIANRRVFAQVPAAAGVPDGLTVDSEGCVWVACARGWRLVRYDPDGSAERIVQLPVSRPTSCAFGGPDLATLYITSARGGLARRALAEAPWSGSLLAIEPGVPGLPEPVFAG